jgi:hypothetical protein
VLCRRKARLLKTEPGIRAWRARQTTGADPKFVITTGFRNLRLSQVARLATMRSRKGWRGRLNLLLENSRRSRLQRGMPLSLDAPPVGGWTNGWRFRLPPGRALSPTFPHLSAEGLDAAQQVNKRGEGLHEV